MRRVQPRPSLKAFSYTCIRLKPHPSHISKQETFLNVSPSTRHYCLLMLILSQRPPYSLPVSVQLTISPLSLSSGFFRTFASQLECQVQSSFWCSYHVVSSRCPEHFLYLLTCSAVCVLWLHFYQGNHCVPRRLRPILWNLQGFWLEDIKHIFKACTKYAYICWSSSAPKRDSKELVGRRATPSIEWFQLPEVEPSSVTREWILLWSANVRPDKYPTLNQFDQQYDH